MSTSTYHPALDDPTAWVPYRYHPSNIAAIIFVVSFSLTTLLHTFQLFKYKTWYFIPLIIGGFCTSPVSNPTPPIPSIILSPQYILTTTQSKSSASQAASSHTTTSGLSAPSSCNPYSYSSRPRCSPHRYILSSDALFCSLTAKSIRL
jgi:hypothetical protein